MEVITKRFYAVKKLTRKPMKVFFTDFDVFYMLQSNYKKRRFFVFSRIQTSKQFLEGNSVKSIISKYRIISYFSYATMFQAHQKLVKSTCIYILVSQFIKTHAQTSEISTVLSHCDISLRKYHMCVYVYTYVCACVYYIYIHTHYCIYMN